MEKITKKPNSREPFGFLNWRLCRDSNPDLTLRRGLFYPVELQRRTVFKLSVLHRNVCQARNCSKPTILFEQILIA